MIYAVKCSWCQKSMGTKEDAGNKFAETLKRMGQPVISYGICPKCRQKILKESEAKIKEGVMFDCDQENNKIPNILL